MEEKIDLIVVKRSGQRVAFNGLKIALAIKKAFESISSNYTEKDENKVYEETLKLLQENYKDRKTINVEDIQDTIEKVLKKEKYFEVYESFSDYRMRRSESRKAFSLKRQHKFVKAIEKIGNYNSKVLNGLTPEDGLLDFGRTVSEEYTKSYVIDNKFVRAFEEGKMFIHNFDYFNLGYLYNSHLKLDDFFTKEEDIIDLLTLLIAAKHEVNGELAIDNFDMIMVKEMLLKYKKSFKQYLKEYLDIMGYLELINYKKISELIDKETAFSYNLDYLEDFMINEKLKQLISKAHSNSYEYLKKYLKATINKIFETLNNTHGINKKYVISLGLLENEEGKLIKDVVFDILKENEYYENVTIVFKVKKNVSLHFLETIANLLIEKKNIKLNFIQSNNHKDCDINYFSNGYRVFVDENYSKTSGRLLVCNSSLNMARLGLTYKSLSKDLYEELDEMLELVKNQLLFVFETIGDKSSDNYKVLFKGNIYDDEKLEEGQQIRKVIKNGTLNINLIGLKELAWCIDKENSNIIQQLLKYIKEKVSNMSVETKLNFTLSAVNSVEASSYFIDLDKTVFGLVPKITNKSKYDDLYKIDLSTLKDLDQICKNLDYLTGGFEVLVNLPSHVTTKKIIEIINMLNSSNISFVSFNIGNSV